MKEKKNIFLYSLFNLTAILVLLYLFFVAIELLGGSFKLIGKETARNLIHSATHSPIIGLLVGTLATAIIQSSSTTTSMVVALVAGGAIDITHAIPVIMGANIGTTITNLIVSTVHIRANKEFERAFAAAVVHDIFNILSVIILLPLQVYFNILGRVASFLEKLFEGIGGIKVSSPIKIITEPIVHFIINLVKKNGYITAIFAFILLIVALTFLVKIIKRVIVGRAQVFFSEVMFKNAAYSLLLGLILTSIVQSSSVTTSLIVPIAAAGILTLEQVFPYTLGANIGTTITAILASLATGNPAAITVAFSHLSFNVIGITILYPFRKIPISLAKTFSKISIKFKLFPILYILVVFFLIPAIIFFIWR